MRPNLRDLKVRAIPDRRPLFSLWIEGRPLSSRSKQPAGYKERIRQAAVREISAPTASSRLEIEIIFGARGHRPDVDNLGKHTLDALKGVLYADDAQVRTIKIVGLKLDESFHARGFKAVFDRLFAGKEFLVNVYEGREVDVYLVDSSVPEDEPSGLVMLTIARPGP